MESLPSLVFRTGRASFPASGSPLTWSVVIDTSFHFAIRRVSLIVTMSVEEHQVVVGILSAARTGNDVIHLQLVSCLETQSAFDTSALLFAIQLGFGWAEVWVLLASH